MDTVHWIRIVGLALGIVGTGMLFSNDLLQRTQELPEEDLPSLVDVLEAALEALWFGGALGAVALPLRHRNLTA